MATVKPIDVSTQTLFNHLLTKYLDDLNFEFACAMHRGLKWELVALEHEEAIKKAAVRHPDGGVMDARGHMSDDEFKNGFEDSVIVSFPLEADLNLRTRSIVPKDIFEAGKLAMSVWPELPWNKDTYVFNMMNFVNDLEKLSRYHDFWIRDTLNIITPSGSGYEVYVTGKGEYRIRLIEEKS